MNSTFIFMLLNLVVCSIHVGYTKKYGFATFHFGAFLVFLMNLNY